MSTVFGFLKKKISGFIDKLTGKEEEKPEEPISKESEKEIETPNVIEKPKIFAKEELPVISKIEKKKEVPESIEPFRKPHVVEHKKEEKKHKEEKKETPKAKPVPKIEKEIPKEAEKSKIKEPLKVAKPKEEIKLPPKIEEKQTTPTPLIQSAPLEEIKQKPKEEAKERQVKVGILSSLKSVITGEVEIKESDVLEMLSNLELELIESDVALEVAESIVTDLKQKLIGKRIKKGELNKFIKSAIEETLLTIISTEGFDLVEKVNASQKPVKIMFLGTNGSGKTTTIAKVAYMLLQSNHSVVLAAADTFRAAAIEQLSIHAERLGVKIIKREYGADPTAVAYDAVGYATAHKADAVLIDTAGRQETNFNLLNEMKKLRRVIKPDITVFIGESIAGNAILSQITEFKNEIGVDAVILTKLDCDAKGGTVLSISKSTGVPIIYLGTGQKYDELEKFNAKEIVKRILS